MTSIPNDLVNEICSRLPSKSIARFRCVSKQWCSMFHRPYFTELFLTRSWARPRLLFAIRGKDAWSFFSLPQPHNPYKNSSSSIVVAADFHMTFPNILRYSCGYASGLICFNDIRIPSEEEVASSMICNPNTGQYSILPKLIMHVYFRPLLGFDPIGKQFKVLFIKADTSFDHVGPLILTLGTGKMRWRKIQCPLIHSLYIISKGICINGVLYYLAKGKYIGFPKAVIVCFDVRSEEFKFVDAESFDFLDTELINYKGRLGVISWKYVGDGSTLELHTCVLKDVEKEEWLKYFCTLRDDMIVDHVGVVGVTATGEIVLSTDFLSKPFDVFFFSPERTTLQRVEIQGFGEYNVKDYHVIEFFVDHVEDLNLSDRCKVSQVKPRPKHH